MSSILSMRGLLPARLLTQSCNLTNGSILPIRRCASSKSNDNDGQPEKSQSSDLAKTELPSDEQEQPRKIARLSDKPEVTDLMKSTLPDENADIPKKHVFQQLRTQRCADFITTLDEAAAPGDVGGIHHFRYPALASNCGYHEYFLRSWDNKYSVVHQWPDLTDFLVVGGGLIGSATAYYLKRVCGRAGDVVVLDKAPYSPHNLTAFSNGLISVQSKCQEVSRMATLSKELIRNLKNDVLVSTDDFAQIKYRPITHLCLWPESEVEEVLESVDQQLQDGCFTEAKLPHELEQAFPWLKAVDTDIALGTHGNQDEALVDPIGLRNLYRTLAQAHGAHFIQGEAVDFNTQYHLNDINISPASTGALVARISNGELKNVFYAKAALCLGHNTPFLEARAEMESFIRDSVEDLHFLQPKLKIGFSFSSLTAPLINFPVITDVDGSTLIRDGISGTFTYYLPIKECEEFQERDWELFIDSERDEPFVNLFHKDKMFEDYFDNVIKPRLVNRVATMEDAKFGHAISGFESVNTFDGSPLISLHPYLRRLLISGGYGNRLMNYAPAAAVAIAELLLYDEEHLFDVTKFYWDRVITNRPLAEFPSLLGGLRRAQ